MGKLRDHNPIVIDQFNGLWRRGSSEECPLDHFPDCNNLVSGSGSSFSTRSGLGISQTVLAPLADIKRIYNYPTITGNTLIILVENASGDGEIYHLVDATTIYGPLLTITGMTDFAFIPYAGRAYISPFDTFVVGGSNVEKGLENEFLYVYLGDGTPARKAALSPLTGALTIANGAAGLTDAGFHLFAFVAETDSGYLTAPGAITGFTTSAASSVSFSTVPTSGSPTITNRYLVATKAIPNYNGDTTGYTFYFVPGGTIANDTDTFLNDVSFFDQDLIDDATHLLENFSEIPAGASLSMYHDRLILCTTFNEISVGYASAIGEPEAFNQVDGLFVVPPDSNPITNAQELRDVLYVMKRSRTVSFIDNGDVPSSWPLVLIDNALGTSVHGIATVLDSGSSSVDYLVVCTYQGVSLFNGRYITPEISWKIEDFWKDQDRNEFRKIQLINAPIQKDIYIILPDGTMLVGNYSQGLDPKKIKWWPISFALGVNTVAIHNIDDIIIGADL